MFTFDELCQLIRVVSESRISGLEVEREGVRVRIDGVPTAPALHALAGPPLLPPQVAAAAAQVPFAPVPASAPGAAAAPAAAAGAADEPGLAFVTSPIVGTFYRAPNPDAEPYVKVGDLVHKGQVLCIVEAMKLMNEIESDVSGTVVKIYPENAQAVEFGERLFAIRPS
jgi:acetyl-CoA carboxylase biotin carboxyl carrier protein